jgi:enterochelin esterase family protein
MLAKLVLIILVVLADASGQIPTYSAAGRNDSASVANLRHQVQSGDAGAVTKFWNAVHKSGAPLVEEVPGEKDFSFLTFLWQGNDRTRNVVIFDGVAGFDAKDRMLHVDGTDVWYKTYRVRKDARFAYNLSPNDSLQSFDEVKGDQAMRDRLAMLQVDPLNPHHCPTTFGAYGAESSYVELSDARPLVWNSPMQGVRRGKVEEKQLHSASLKADKKVWVYTPPAFRKAGGRYPLLVLSDGDRNVMWIPKLLDTLIAQGKIPSMVAVMTDESVPSIRTRELECDVQFEDFLAKELVPWTRENYDTTALPEMTIVAGSSLGGLAAVYAGLEHPEVFGKVISLSGSFWWKPAGSTEAEWLTNLVQRSPKLPLRFYLEVGLMESQSMQIETNRRMRDALIAKGYPVGYSEYDGGHSFLTWSSGMVNGLETLIGLSGSGRAGSGPRVVKGKIVVMPDM